MFKNIVLFCLENTRNRYPWICSLRSRKKSKKHQCALTLLSRPPSPLVLVGPAHCTYLCKSSLGEVENCCCGGPNDCSSNTRRCGNNSKVMEMTGEDAEIICGEWETGNSYNSEENYNLILNIKEVIRHPDYAVNTDSSAYLVNDVAVFKVDETLISRLDFDIWKIYPACLPVGNSVSKTGIHSGWSSPIPKHILEKYAPGFAHVYREFFKQVHYKMEILDKCEDDNIFIKVNEQPVKFPTNTYYPPGILSFILLMFNS